MVMDTPHSSEHVVKGGDDNEVLFIGKDIAASIAEKIKVKARFALNKRKLEEKKREYELDTRLREAAEEEARVKELRRERRRDKKRKLIETDDPEDDAPVQSELAQIMGFSGFGGPKK